jgi:ribosomal protein S18 acetylase RimI-like enzyme
MTVTLRAESARDETFLRRLILETISIELGAAGWPEPMRSHLLGIQCDVRRRSWRAGLPDARSSVIQADGVDAGWIVVAGMPDQFYLAEIMVLPELRSQGIGTAAVGGVLGAAREAGVPVRLRVNATNHPAIRFYHRLGFRRIEADDENEVQYLMECRPAPGG